MSWNYAEIAQRDEIAELKKQFAVNETKLAALQDQLFKQSEELNTTKETLAETLDKLRKEADNATELESKLTWGADELQKEKLARQNTEIALQEARAELRDKVASVKESEHFLSQMAHSATTSQAEHTKLLNEKAKLEQQVKELVAQVRHLQAVQPTSTAKPATRPRSSSLTNLKLATLEHDLEQLRNTATSSQTELDSAKAKLVQARDQLLRVENEKLVVEKRLRENSQLLKDVVEEKQDLKREVEYLRGHNGSEERENELLSRLDEEERKVALLEAELAKLSRSKVTKQSLDALQNQLKKEVGRRESAEQRELELVQQKEEALNELFEIKENMRELKEKLSLRDMRIKELEKLESKLFESLDAGTPHSRYNQQVAPELEKSVEEMLAAIGRLRMERDQLRIDFDYLQMETRFQVEALQSQVTRLQSRNHQDAAEVEGQRPEMEQLRLALKEERVRRGRLQIAFSAMSLVTQHLQQENDEVHGEALKVFSSHNEASFRLRANLDDLQSKLTSKETEIASLSLTITTLKEQLSSKTQEFERLSESSRVALASKDEEVAQLHAQLSQAVETIGDGSTERDALKNEVRRLDSELSLASAELEEARRGYDRLKAVQTSALSSDATTRAMQDEIELLKDRITRRTEQIGVHQHDIKRLETNLRLMEERVEELTTDLEMASTEKEAMLEDCTTTRNERDEAQKALETAEVEIDKLTASVARMQEQINALQLSVTTSQREKEELDLLRVQELATMVALVAERDCRIRSLVASLRVANVDVQRAQMHVSSLSTELDSVRSSITQTVEDFHAQKEDKLKVLADELESKAEAVQRLASELDTARTREGELSETLKVRINELERAKEQIAALETSKNELLVQIETFEVEAQRATEESSNLRSALEEEHSKYTSIIKSLEEELASVRASKEAELEESKKANDDLQEQLKRLDETLQSINDELAESRALCERLEADHEVASGDQTREVAELQSQVKLLTEESERLQHNLQEEIDGRQREREAQLTELKAELNKHELAVAKEIELREELESYKTQLAELQSKLDELNAVKVNMQTEIDNLSADCHRSKLQSECLEKQIVSNEKGLNVLRDEIGAVRQSLSQSEKDCRAAEMKLVLAAQQHEQAISSIRSQLKVHEKDSEMVLELREVITGLKEQIAEMDDLLRVKSREIEENDDQFIELLKEKRKLKDKVESLTRKNQSLRKKVEIAEAASKLPSSVNQASQLPPPTTANANAPALTPPTKSASLASPAFAKPVYSTLPSPKSTRTPEAPRAISATFPSTREQGSATTPINKKVALATTPTIGKKRPLPEDSDPRSVPVAAIICEEPRIMSTPPMSSSSSMSSVPPMPSMPSASSQADHSTPRTRRPLQTLRSGFTPNRGQGNTLRPTLSQPSPIRKTATQALHIATAITDMTNSPAAKRVFSSVSQPASQKPPTRGWLGKIRGGNALLKTRQQRSAEEHI